VGRLELKFGYAEHNHELVTENATNRHTFEHSVKVYR